MVKTKGISATTDNWTGAIPGVASKYARGVQNASGVIDASIKAEALYKIKMQEAINNKSREKGLRKVSDDDWKKAALDKGQQRIAGGMMAAQGKYAEKMGKVISTIESTTLPDRTADIMQNVTNRCGGMAKALADAKKSGKF